MGPRVEVMTGIAPDQFATEVIRGLSPRRTQEQANPHRAELRRARECAASRKTINGTEGGRTCSLRTKPTRRISSTRTPRGCRSRRLPYLLIRHCAVGVQVVVSESELLIEKLQAAKGQYGRCNQNSGLDRAIEIVRQHDAEQPQEVVERVANALLRVRGNSGQYGGSNPPTIQDEAKAAIAAMRIG